MSAISQSQWQYSSHGQPLFASGINVSAGTDGGLVRILDPKTIFPREITAVLAPRNLLHRYLSYIRRATLSIIRPIISENGVEFRFLATHWNLIILLKPAEDGDTLILRICGGLLVQKHQCDRGELRIVVKRVFAGTMVTLQLSDYCPLILGGSSPSKIRYWLYRLTQSTIHRLVTMRFLVLLYRVILPDLPPVSKLLPGRFEKVSSCKLYKKRLQSEDAAIY